jgi:hypothetical protein
MVLDNSIVGTLQRIAKYGYFLCAVPRQMRTVEFTHSVFTRTFAQATVCM